MKIIEPQNYRSVPWKNGRGVTQEIACVPEVSNYDWRLSIAEMSADGAFSCFPGMSRILTVIEGDGIELVASDGEARVLPFQPHKFSGALEIYGRLSGQVVRNFNLIYAGDRYRADAKVVSGSECQFDTSDVTIVFVVKGKAKVGDVVLTEQQTGISEQQALMVQVERENIAIVLTLCSSA